MTSPGYYLLDVAVAGLVAEVLFNDVPVFARADGVPAQSAAKLNGWAVNGPNTLTVRLAALAGASPPPRFDLTLRSGRPGASDAEDQILAAYAWSPERPLTPAPTTVFQQTMALTAPAAWSWTRATPLPRLSDADLDALGGLLERLRAALADRAVDEVVRLQSTQVSEQAVAFGQDAAAMRGAYADFLRERMADPGWRVQPLDRRGLRAATVAGGRVHHVTDALGAPPIVTFSEEGRFAIDPYVARVEGQWSIVR